MALTFTPSLNKFMARSKHKQKASFAGIPRVVMDSPDYTGLSGNAIRLLNELAYQFKGANNGDLCASWTLMKIRGFSSKTTLTKVIRELKTADLIIETRQGQFIKSVPTLYALTWLPINECKGKRLDIPPSKTPLRNFHLEKNNNWRK